MSSEGEGKKEEQSAGPHQLSCNLVLRYSTSCYSELFCLLQAPLAWGLPPQESFHRLKLETSGPEKEYTLTWHIPAKARVVADLPVWVSVFGVVDIHCAKRKQAGQLGLTCLDACPLFHPGTNGWAVYCKQPAAFRIESVSFPSCADSTFQDLKNLEHALFQFCAASSLMVNNQAVPFSYEYERPDNLCWFGSPLSAHMPGALFVYLELCRVHDRVKEDLPPDQEGLAYDHRDDSRYPADRKTWSSFFQRLAEGQDSTRAAWAAHWGWQCRWAMHRLGLDDKIVLEAAAKCSPRPAGGSEQPAALLTWLSKRWDGQAGGWLALLAEIVCELVGWLSRSQRYLPDGLHVCRAALKPGQGGHHVCPRDQVRSTLDVAEGSDLALRCDDCESHNLACLQQFYLLYFWLASLPIDEIDLLPFTLAAVRLCVLHHYEAVLAVGLTNFEKKLGDSPAGRQSHVYCLLVPRGWLDPRREAAWERAQCRRGQAELTPEAARSALAVQQEKLKLPRLSRQAPLPILLLDGTSLALGSQNLYPTHPDYPQTALVERWRQPRKVRKLLSKVVSALAHVRENSRLSCNSQACAKGYISATTFYAPGPAAIQKGSSGRSQGCRGEFLVRWSMPGRKVMCAAVPLRNLLEDRGWEDDGGGRPIVDLECVGGPWRNMQNDPTVQYLRRALPQLLVPSPVPRKDCLAEYLKLVPTEEAEGPASSFYWAAWRTKDVEGGAGKLALRLPEGTLKLSVADDFKVYYVRLDKLRRGAAGSVPCGADNGIAGPAKFCLHCGRGAKPQGEGGGPLEYPPKL